MNRRDFITNSVAGAGWMATSSWAAAPTSERIKIGQIGVTHEHAGVRMNSLRKLLSEQFEVVGIVDDRASKVARSKSASSNLKPYEGLPWLTEEELFKVPGLQAVIVETANADLVPTAIRCMEKGFHVSMDKPGGEDFSLFTKLIEGCKSKDLAFQMGYMFRKNPAIELIQKAVREGWLGDVFEIEASMNHNYGNEEYQKYLSAYQGGIMFNLACHHIDWVVSILGRPKKVTPLLSSTKQAKHGVKNLGLAILEYPHALVSIRANDAEVNGLQNRRVKVCGTRGTMEICPIESFDGKPLLLDLRLKEAAGGYAKGNHVVDFGVQKDRYDLQLAEFGRMVKREVKSPYSFEHDLLAQEVHLAASGYTPWKG